MIHNGSVVYTVRLDESTQDALERQVVNLWDGAREREDHDQNSSPRVCRYEGQMSFSGSSAAIHMRNGSSNLTGIMSSQQGEKDNALKLQSRNKR